MNARVAEAIPSQQKLQSLVGQAFSVADAEGRSVPATLVSVHDGVALDHEYTSYSAIFSLAPGITAPQGSYQIAPVPAVGETPTHPGWLLFVTPVRPGRGGQPRLEAVFHVERESAVAATGGDASPI